MRVLLTVLSLLLAPAAWGGAYMEAGLGQAVPLGSQVLEGGSQVDLGGGWVSRTDSRVLRVGGALGMSHHDGLHYAEQGSLFSSGVLDSAELTQGDSLMRSLTGRLAYTRLVHPRIGLGFRADLGVGDMPLLMQQEAYLTRVVSDEWWSTEAVVHDQLQVLGGAGFLFQWTSPGGVGLGLFEGITYRSGLGLVDVFGVQLSWETP